MSAASKFPRRSANTRELTNFVARLRRAQAGCVHRYRRQSRPLYLHRDEEPARAARNLVRAGPPQPRPSARQSPDQRSARRRYRDPRSRARRSARQIPAGAGTGARYRAVPDRRRCAGRPAGYEVDDRALRRYRRAQRTERSRSRSTSSATSARRSPAWRARCATIAASCRSKCSKRATRPSA